MMALYSIPVSHERMNGHPGHLSVYDHVPGSACPKARRADNR